MTLKNNEIDQSFDSENRESDNKDGNFKDLDRTINFDFLSAARQISISQGNGKNFFESGTKQDRLEFLDFPPLDGFKIARSDRVLHSLRNEENPVDSLLPDKKINTTALIDAIREHGKVRLIMVDDWNPDHRRSGIPGTTHGDNTQRAEYENLPALLKRRIEFVPLDQAVYGANGAVERANALLKDGVPSVVSIANDNELKLDQVNGLLGQRISSLSELSDAKRSQVVTRLLEMPDVPAAQELRTLQEMTRTNNPVIVASGNDNIQVSALVQNAIVTQSASNHFIKLPFADALANGDNTSQSTRSTVRLTLVGLLKGAFPEEGRDASPMGRHPER